MQVLGGAKIGMRASYFVPLSLYLGVHALNIRVAGLCISLDKIEMPSFFFRNSGYRYYLARYFQ